jgi:hypothetical protein
MESSALRTGSRSRHSKRIGQARLLEAAFERLLIICGQIVERASAIASGAAGTDSRGWSACREPPSTFSMMASVAGPGRSDPKHPFPPMTMDSLPTIALTTRARCETSRQVHQLCPSAALRRILNPSSRGLDETQPCLPRPPLELFGGELVRRSCPSRSPSSADTCSGGLAGPSEATSCSLSIRDPLAREIATEPSMGVELARKDAREVPPEANRQAIPVAHPNARTRRERYLRRKWPRASSAPNPRLPEPKALGVVPALGGSTCPSRRSR